MRKSQHKEKENKTKIPEGKPEFTVSSFEEWVQYSPVLVTPFQLQEQLHKRGCI